LGAIGLLLLGRLDLNAIAIIAGGVWGFAFGVQKQNLEEIKLFKELFEQFNARCDDLNDELNRIYLQPSDLSLKECEVKTLFKYFNLCGEEYLYFEKGFICPEVRRAWENGMKFFRQNPRIKKLWDDDLGCGSYYGLDFK
jgi:hypothetical protein